MTPELVYLHIQKALLRRLFQPKRSCREVAKMRAHNYKISSGHVCVPKAAWAEESSCNPPQSLQIESRTARHDKHTPIGCE